MKRNFVEKKKMRQRAKKKQKINRLEVYLETGINEYNQGNWAVAKEKFKKIISIEPGNIRALWYLGIIAHKSGNIDEAMSMMRQSLQIDPSFTHGHNSLGLFYHDKGQLEEAINCFKKAIEISPDFSASYNNIGRVYYDQGLYGKAKINYEKALSLNPGFPDAHYNLGVVYSKERCYLQALQSYRQALSINSGYADAYNNIGTVLMNLGQLAEAEQNFHQALSLNPSFLPAYSNLLFALSIDPDHSTAEYLTAARNYGALLSAKARPYTEWAALKNDAPPLRVGLVSGDLRRHPVGYFLEMVLHYLSKKQVELLAYTTQLIEDDLSERIKPCFASWKTLVGLSDAEAAQSIHDDGVHILIDLTGHCSYNRLPVFSWKPAPVQVTWLGYFASTGVEQMDYLIADRTGVPDDRQSLCTEQIYYLPETRLCFTKPDVELPVEPLPALNRGHITFGCFQDLCKLNDAVLDAWAKIIDEVPNAVLRLQNMAMDDHAMHDLLLDRLERKNISVDRIMLHGMVPREEYLANYSQVDIILDTFPYPGGTTTCEALWMGVPTLTLAGNSLLARQGASLLTAAGLSEWITSSQDEYIEKAVAFAHDLAELARLRSGLREHISRSPLFDAFSFADNLENALFDIWKSRDKENPPGTGPVD